MEYTQSYAGLLESGMRKKKKSMGSGKNYRGPVEGSPDPSFLRDMGYSQKKKKRKKGT